MSKIDQARDLLKQLGVPVRQQSDICGYSILAMAGVREDGDWSGATNDWIRIHDIIGYIRENYGVTYAENS